MYKKMIVSLLMISVGLLCYAQTAYKDIVDKNKAAVMWFHKGADVYLDDMDSSYRCFERALALFRETKSCSDEALCLQYMASIMSNKNKNDEALQMFNLADNVAVRCGDTTRIIKVLNEKQRLLYEMGRMKERAVVMGRIAELGCQEDDVQARIECYEMQGKNAQDDGDYQLAETMYEKSMALVPMLPKKLQMTTKGKLLIAMRDLKQSQKMYPQALEYGRQLLEIHKTERENLAFDYQMMAFLYSKMKDEKRTMLYMDSTVACVGDNTNLFIEISDLLISSLSNIEKYGEALSLAERVDGAIIFEYGQHNIKRINLLFFMGNIYNAIGETKKCLEKYEECERLTLEVYGAESDEHIMALGGLANSLALAGHIDEGAAKYVELQKMLSEIAKESMGSMTKAERENYWNKTADTMHSMTSYGLAGNVKTKEFIEAACNALIFSKSLLLESEVSLKDLVEKKGTAEDKERLRRITMTKYVLDSLRKNYDTNIDEIVRLKLKLSNDDVLLSSRFKKYSEYTDFLNITIEDIRKAMPANSILIDYTDIKTINGHYHAAFVSNGDTRKTDMLLVFDWNKVEKLLGRKPLDVLYKDYMNDSARALIWDPLSKYADEGCTIYYVPAGKMHQISLESFTAPDGKLLGEHYKFVRLTSARELVKKRDAVRKPTKAVLYGGLKYEMSSDSMLAESRKYQNAPLIAESKRDVRGDSAFSELRYSLEEIGSIESLLRSAGVKVTPYSGVHGNEESFIALSGNAPDIIHLATHGYYFTPEEAAAVSYVKGYDDAMMMSGLVMSGANATKRGNAVAEGVRDGMLSAADVSTMNLKGTDMVVLSACETGLGKVTPEGVYGLQRAFKLAGVKTIVMTLWSVDDRATKEFMVKFYERLVANSWDKRKSFDEAREYMRKKNPESPYYWAGFVMLD